MSKETKTIEATLKIPKPIYDFYTGLSQSENKVFENFLVEELISNVETHLDIEPNMRNLIIHLFNLESIEVKRK